MTDWQKFNQSYLIRCPYIAYFLGFFWGDGYLFKHTRWRTRGVGCDQNAEDFIHVKEIFERVDDGWRTFDRIINEKKYPRIYKTDWPMHDWLFDLGYQDKSVSHQRVLNIIHQDYQRFFILGLFDADGNIFCQPDGKQARACIVGPINQDWSALENLLSHNGIKNYIEKRIDKNEHEYSYIHLDGVAQIPKFFDFLYKNTSPDLFFQRKKDKFDLVVKYLPIEYGSLRYLEYVKFDYSSFNFPDFKVIRCMNPEDSDSKWECIYENGRVEYYGSSYMSNLKNMVLRGEYKSSFKTTRKYNHIHFNNRLGKWFADVYDPTSGKRWQKRTDCEEKAAKISDCAMIVLQNASKETLNFPELYDFYIQNKDELMAKRKRSKNKSKINEAGKVEEFEKFKEELGNL